MKKTLIACLVLFLNVSTMPIIAKENANENNSSYCSTDKVIKVGEYINDKGNTTVVFEDGIEVEYENNGDIIIRDKANIFGADLDSLSDAQARSVWTLLGKIIYNLLNVCSLVDYVTDVDLCGIAAKYLTTPEPNREYGVYAFRTATHVPGCYPSSSPQCIVYGVEYRFVIMN